MPIEMPGNPSSLRTIIVPIDFSAPARRALEWATALATKSQAKIVLVHAIEPHPFGRAPEVDRMLMDAATLKLDESCKPIIEEGLSVSTECNVGKPWVVACEAADNAKADLIVIGSRGLTGLDRVMLGSTADRVLRTAAQPVLTVHPTDARPAFQHALVATDLSDSPRTALTTALRMLDGAAQQVQVTLLHVSIPPIAYAGTELAVDLMPDWNRIDRDARRNLETLANSIRSDRVRVTTDVVRGYPARTIVEEARSRNVDLIALGTRSAIGLERFFLGSVAERVIHHASCPVLTAQTPVTVKDRDTDRRPSRSTVKRATSVT